MSEGTVWAFPRSVALEQFAARLMPDAGIFGGPPGHQAGVLKLQACLEVVCRSVSGFSPSPQS